VTEFNIDNLPTHPDWLTEEASQVLGAGYMLPGEVPRDMWKRCSLSAERYLKIPGIGEDIMEMFWMGYLGGASPVLSNFGTNRGLPISCLETGTRIHTPGGYKEIQELVPGDLVLTHLGNWKRVVNVWSRQTTGDLYKLSVSNRWNYELNITGNHPVLTNKGWVKVEDLDPETHQIYITPVVDTLEENPEHIVLSDYFRVEKQNRETTVWDIEVEDDHSFVAQGVVVHNCYSTHLSDNVPSIFSHLKEVASLSKYGGGVGVYFGDVRPSGAPITGGGKSTGIVPWMRQYDLTASVVSQGSTRRGSFALYLPIDHSDLKEALRSKDHSKGDPRKFIDSNLAVLIKDEWIEDMIKGDKEKQSLFAEVLKCRMISGSPYLVFIDNANNQRPECFKQRNLEIFTSNLCSEIFLPTDENHTFVCVLSSLNLAKYDEWRHWTGKNTGKTAPELAIYFLDAVVEEFIHKAERLNSMGRAVRFARKSRALGLGTMGKHALYQSRGLAFDSKASRELNIEAHSWIDEMTLKASKQMAVEFGEPEWCEGNGVRHATRLAIAPTKTNSVICGAVSEGIEPLTANLFVAGNDKGTFVRRNPYLENHLIAIGKNTKEVWDSILEERGSVQHLDFLSDHARNVFKTAREIDQFEIIRQNADTQKYVCQGISTNLYVEPEAPASYIMALHLVAWKLKLKSLYYLKSTSLQAKKSKPATVKTKPIALVVTKHDCPWCVKAKSLLTSQGYLIQEVDRSTISDSEWSYKTVPQIWIDGNHVEGGYDGLTKLFSKDEEQYADCAACQG
jgi:ribonucleoside-diphosphate reductase alpha chain